MTSGRQVPSIAIGSWQMPWPTAVSACRPACSSRRQRTTSCAICASTVEEGAPFPELLDRAARRLVDEFGLAGAFSRLAGLPVPTPAALRDSLLELKPTGGVVPPGQPRHPVRLPGSSGADRRATADTRRPARSELRRVSTACWPMSRFGSRGCSRCYSGRNAGWNARPGGVSCRRRYALRPFGRTRNASRTSCSPPRDSRTRWRRPSTAGTRAGSSPGCCGIRPTKASQLHRPWSPRRLCCWAWLVWLSGMKSELVVEGRRDAMLACVSNRGSDGGRWPNAQLFWPNGSADSLGSILGKYYPSLRASLDVDGLGERISPDFAAAVAAASYRGARARPGEVGSLEAPAGGPPEPACPCRARARRRPVAAAGLAGHGSRGRADSHRRGSMVGADCSAARRRGGDRRRADPAGRARFQARSGQESWSGVAAAPRIRSDIAHHISDAAAQLCRGPTATRVAERLAQAARALAAASPEAARLWREILERLVSEFPYTEAAGPLASAYRAACPARPSAAPWSMNEDPFTDLRVRSGTLVRRQEFKLGSSP